MIEHEKYILLINALQESHSISIKDLSLKLDCDRKAIKEKVIALAELGAPLKANGQYVSLIRNSYIELLSDLQIRKSLDTQANQKEVDIHLFATIGSTNQHLKNFKTVSGQNSIVSIAECQTAGVGRLGKRWVSPFGGNIYFSMRTKVIVPTHKLGSFSLVVGISVIETLRLFGLENLNLKWPNDIYYNGKKLSGVLIEIVAHDKYSVDLIIGIGINVKMDNRFSANIEQEWIDLDTLTEDCIMSRNKIIATLINTLHRSIEKYEAEGFSQFREIWKDVDYLYGKRVDTFGTKNQYSGIAEGITANGELMINLDGNVVNISSGEVSVRLT